MEEPWTDLLNAWRAKGKFGLTIPFLFGGLLKHPASPLGDAGNLEEKFQKMLGLISKYGVEGKCARLSYCGTANDLIVSQVLGKPAECKRVVDSDSHQLQLWIQHDILADDSPPIASLTKSLWERYGAIICEERYSRRKGEYHSFDERDNQLLIEAYAQNT